MNLAQMKWYARWAGFVVLILFLFGVVWSVVPIQGMTLPHEIERDLGLSFKWAALLDPAFLALLAVSSISLFSAYEVLSEPGDKTKA